MRLSILISSLVCYFAMSSTAAVQAVPYLVFSSGESTIYSHRVNGAGTPNSISSIAATTPGKSAILGDEIFVSNGAANTVSRYLQTDGVLTANPTHPTIVSSGNIDNPNGIAFRNEELFINSFDDNRVVRYTFNGSGAAVASPTSSFITTTPEIVGTRGRGVAFSPTGDRMYVTGCCGPTDNDSVVAVYSIDLAGTVAFLSEIQPTDLDIFSIALDNAQAITVSDTGELWIADAGSALDPSLADIARLTVDASGTLTGAEVVVSGSDVNLARPTDLVFDPNGDLLVANLGNTGTGGDGFLTRFNLDGAGGVLSSLQFGNGDQYRGINVIELAVPPVPEPSSLWLLTLGACGLLRRVRKSRQREVV